MASLDAAAQLYKEEAYEMLAQLEECLLELEDRPDDSALVARAFRAMHTIKGSGAMFGFDEIARFTHHAETTLDMIREGTLSISPELLNIFLKVKDHIHVLVSTHPDISPEMVTMSDDIMISLASLVPESEVVAPVDKAEVVHTNASPPVSQEIFWIRYAPAADSFTTGANPLGLIEELSEFGTTGVKFHDSAIPVLTLIDPEIVYGWWDVILVTDKGVNAINDVFIFEEPDNFRINTIGPGSVRMSDIDVYLDIITGNLEAAETELLKKFRELYSSQTSRRETPGKSGSIGPASTGNAAISSIRVDSNRLDQLVNMVGEMVIIQSRLSQAAVAHDLPAVVHQISEDLERLTSEMRDNALGLRMLPIGSSFSMFRRLVHDLSASLGKEVELVTQGGDTELDKTVIDQLKDPLVHIIRNCLDHGIESPSEREKAGKPKKGTVTLSARHSSGHVLITITDDGKGMDHTSILAKAVAKGLAPQDVDMSEKEILAYIFEPGFSMAASVSDVSGRGVGMDVVKRCIDSLRGSIDLESAIGQGTTITIRLPLTLAIIDGFNVLIGNESYVIPLTSLCGFQERFLSASPDTIETIERMGELIPCISLRRLLKVPGEQPEYERIVIADVNGTSVGMAVDQVIGRQQAVIKSLDESCRDLKWISGTTINGDGSISLILDIPQLCRFASQASGGSRQ